MNGAGENAACTQRRDGIGPETSRLQQLTVESCCEPASFLVRRPVWCRGETKERRRCSGATGDVDSDESENLRVDRREHAVRLVDDDGPDPLRHQLKRTFSLLRCACRSVFFTD